MPRVLTNSAPYTKRPPVMAARKVSRLLIGSMLITYVLLTRRIDDRTRCNAVSFVKH